jgi:hypothetical protein
MHQINVDRILEEAMGWDLPIRCGAYGYHIAPIRLQTLLQLEGMGKVAAGVIEKRREIILPLLRPTPLPDSLDDLDITVIMTVLLEYAGHKLKNLQGIAPRIGEAVRRHLRDLLNATAPTTPTLARP